MVVSGWGERLGGAIREANEGAPRARSSLQAASMLFGLDSRDR